MSSSKALRILVISEPCRPWARRRCRAAAAAELLGNLEADGLGAFFGVVVEPQVHALTKRFPVVALGNLRAEAIHMVIVTIDANQRCSIDLGVEDLGRFKIARHENVGLQAKARGVRGDGVGKIAGGRTADGLEAKGLRVGKRNSNDAIFKAESGHADGVVFEIEIARANVLRWPRGGGKSEQSGVRPTGVWGV